MTRCLLIPFCLCLCSPAFAGDPPPLKASTVKPGDTVVIGAEVGTTTVTVTSEKGIGSGQLVRPGEKWPAKVVIRLRLGNLEGFSLDNGRVRMAASLKTQDAIDYWKGGPDDPQPLPGDRTRSIPILQKGDWIEVSVPAEILDPGVRQVDFSWIDAYRN